MSVETMMTLALAGVILVSALVILGILTLLTRITMFVLRPAAREGYVLARRHAPTAAAGLAAFWERTAAIAVALSQRFAAWARPASRTAAARTGVLAQRSARWAGMTSRQMGGSAAAIGSRAARSLTAAAEDLGDRTVQGVSTYVAPAVRSLVSGDDDVMDTTFVPVRHRIRHG